MLVFPPCKINLGLKILRKRADGFHDLETLFYPIPLCDALEIGDAEEVDGETAHLWQDGLPVAGETKNNLILKAYRLLAQDYDLKPVQFCLLKTIPMGAGLGGGSSDGAYAIRLLNEYFNLNISLEKQLNYAAQLGSDCAFFIYNQPCFGSARGEILEPSEFSLNKYWLALIKPNIHISTAQAFANIIPCEFEAGMDLKQIIEMPIETWKEHLKNDFEESLFPSFPELKFIKEYLYNQGAVYAAMSGSGSTVFGLFRSEPKLEKTNPDYFYWEGKLS